MKDNMARIEICPRCGKTYAGRPAVSRMDNETLICPDCGTREALTALDIDEQEQDAILRAIHRCYGHRIPD